VLPLRFFFAAEAPARQQKSVRGRRFLAITSPPLPTRVSTPWKLGKGMATGPLRRRADTGGPCPPAPASKVRLSSFLSPYLFVLSFNTPAPAPPPVVRGGRTRSVLLLLRNFACGAGVLKKSPHATSTCVPVGMAAGIGAA